MLGSCLTCLSSKKLLVLGELEWKMFDFLLHPISMKYPNLRKNGMARLCSNCKKRMKFIADFRRTAVFNFKQLMNTWDMASTSVTEFKVPAQCTLKKVKKDVLTDKERIETQNIGTEEIIKADSIETHTEIEVPFEPEDLNTDATNKKKFITETYAVQSETDDHREEAKNEGYLIEYLGESDISDTEIEYDKTEGTKDADDTVPGIQPWTCTVCNKANKTRRDMNRHMKSHNVKKKDVYCEVCDKWFTKQTFKYHLKRSVKHRDDAQRTQCEICNKSYIDEKALKTHIKNIHEVGDTKMQCIPCNKWFTPYSYKIHLLISAKHVGEDKLRFICDHCNKKFINKSLLRQHIITVHLKLRSCLLLCPYCPKMFPGMSKVNSHIRVMHDSTPVPKSHVCEVCGKGYTSGIGLRKHLLVHSIEENYKCGECDSKFRFKHTLISHNLYAHGIRMRRKRNPPQNNKSENTEQTAKENNTSLNNEEIMAKRKASQNNEITEQEQAAAIKAIRDIM